MSNLKYSQFQKLRANGREPIELPAEIYFSGNVERQKQHCDTAACKPGACICGKGMHHLQEFQKTGTYWHPSLCAQRLRVAEDRLKRAQEMKASDTELQKSDGSLETMKLNIERCEKELNDVLSGKNPEANKLFVEDQKVAKEETVEFVGAEQGSVAATVIAPSSVSTGTISVKTSPVSAVQTADVMPKKKRGRPAKIDAEPVDPNEDHIAAAIAAAKGAGMGLESDKD